MKHGHIINACLRYFRRMAEDTQSGQQRGPTRSNLSSATGPGVARPSSSSVDRPENSQTNENETGGESNESVEEEEPNCPVQ